MQLYDSKCNPHDFSCAINKQIVTLTFGCKTAAFSLLDLNRLISSEITDACFSIAPALRKYLASSINDSIMFIEITDPSIQLKLPKKRLSTILEAAKKGPGIGLTTKSREYGSTDRSTETFYIIYTGDISKLTPDDLKSMQATSRPGHFTIYRSGEPDPYITKTKQLTLALKD